MNSSCCFVAAARASQLYAQHSPCTLQLARTAHKIQPSNRTADVSGLLVLGVYPMQLPSFAAFED
jgi:hypothetical protein